MANDYTTKTASIMATVGNIRKLKTRVFDAQEIKLNGQDIQELWGFQNPEDFNELVKRYNLPTDEDYIIWTDSGNVAHMSFADVLTDGTSLFENSGIDAWDISMPKLDNGQNMFKDTSITGFEGDVSSLVNGEGMFQGCTNLSLFDADLSSLRTGYGMFDSKLGNTSTTAATAETGEDDIEMTRCPLTPESIHKISGWMGSIDDVKDIPLGYQMAKAIYNKTLPHLKDNNGHAGSIPYIKDLDRAVDSNWAYNGGVIDANTDTVCKRGIIHMGYPHEPMTEDESKLVDVCFCYITGVKGWRLFVDGVEWTWPNIDPPPPPDPDPDPDPDRWIPHWFWGSGSGGGGNTTSRTINYNRAWSQVMEYDTLHPTSSTSTQITSIINNVVSDGTVLGATAFEGPTQEIGSVSVAKSGKDSNSGMRYHNSGMLSYTEIDEFNSPLTKLAHGKMMCNQCQKLTKFDSSTGIPKLQTANDMFNGCIALPAFPTNSTNSLMKEFLVLDEAPRMFKDCTSLDSFSAYVPKLEIANEMFEGCSKLRVFDPSGGSTYSDLDNLRLANKMFYNTILGSSSTTGAAGTTEWLIDLPELEEGNLMFSKTYIMKWDGNLGKLKKNNKMFKECSVLEEFKGRLTNIEKANEMFADCISLQSVDTVLTRLENGNQMFNGCRALTTFTVPALPSLKVGIEMFQNTAITKWENSKSGKLNMSKLRVADRMFNGCTALATFKGNIGKVDSDEHEMFGGCSSLTTFIGDINDMRKTTLLFEDCTNMISFEGALPKTFYSDEMFNGKSSFTTFKSSDTHSLYSAKSMFKGTSLTTFQASNLNNLNHGQSMFEGTPIKEFTNTTDNLLFGNQMFKDCTSLTTFTGKLGSLEDGTEMFSGTTALKLFSGGDMNELEIANNMFTNSGIVSFISNMPKLTDTTDMFKSCGSLYSFKGNLNSIISHKNMFSGCSALKQFSGDLTSLEYGTSMFETAPNLTTFETKTLKNLKYGERMFYGTALESFDVEKEDTENAEVQAMNLSSLTNGTEMFANCTQLKEFEKADLSSLVNGTKMFYKADLESFNAELTNLKNATDMFRYNSNLVSFIGDTSNLTTSLRMFSDCTSLKQFSGNLNNLTNSDGTGGKSGMFNECKNLESFKAEMPKLTTGYNFFYGCTKLSEFDCKSLSNMTMGYQMFCQCKSIKKISTKLDNLVNGKSLCHGCASLTEFDPGENGLKLLTNGAYMFSNCRLDSASVKRVLENITQFTGTHVEPHVDDTTTSGEGYLQIGMQASAISTFEEVTGLSVTVHKEGGYNKNGVLQVNGNGWMDYKGWKIGGWIANYFA